MSNNPYAGRVPIHLRKEGSDLSKSATSYREGIKHPSTNRMPKDRNVGCTPLRRYANGLLDVDYVAGEVISLIHKAQDGGNLTAFEMSLLSVIIPGKFKLVAKPIAQTHTRLSDEEKALVAIKVMQHMGEEKNWNAGMGGGSVPLRSTTRS